MTCSCASVQCQGNLLEPTQPGPSTGTTGALPCLATCPVLPGRAHQSRAASKSVIIVKFPPALSLSPDLASLSPHHWRPGPYSAVSVSPVTRTRTSGNDGLNMNTISRIKIENKGQCVLNNPFLVNLFSLANSFSWCYIAYLFKL